jgi:cation diffusion facilitator CzcD-associated flavoprotein CzcO
MYPTIPGMEDFQGHVIHSHDYRSPEMFRDKVVVCLGAGASGQDIAVEVSCEASMVIIYFFLP